MSELQINTTQNVNISFTAASLGERILAFLIDIVIIIAYVYGVFHLVFKLFGIDNIEDNWSRMAVTMLIMLPAILYTLISEIYMEGQTLGKKVMKIQVVKIDGYQASILDFFMRWLFRTVEIFTFIGTGAILSIAISKNSQRIGGMASGTAVISLKNRVNINHTILENIDELYVPTYPSVINLSDNDVRIIKDTYNTAIKSNDYKTINKLRIKVEEITKSSKGESTNITYLKTILKDYTHITQDM
jgi:uncharacterized RDD family membrane protein YckC